MDNIAAPGRRTMACALVVASPDLNVVGLAAHYDEIISGCIATEPQVLVADVAPPVSRSVGRRLLQAEQK